MVDVKKICKFIQARLGGLIKIESAKEGNLLTDPPIPQIWVEGFANVNGLLFEFQTTLSPHEIDRWENDGTK